MRSVVPLQKNMAENSRWLAALCLLIAYVSPAKFPGISGWLGAGGFLLLAATLFTTPRISAPSRFGPRITSIKYVLVAVSLMLVVASVVVWSVDR